MARLILTSSFNTVAQELYSKGLLPKVPAKVAFIVTAGDPYEDRFWIDNDRKALVELGYDVIDTDLKNKTVAMLYDELQSSDIIFVAGGNTTYLVEQVHRSGFDKVVRKLLDTRLFIGSSAGSILAGPTTEPFVEEDLPDLSKDFTISDTNCLNFVNYIVLPHYPKYQEPNDAVAKKHPQFTFAKMTDNDYKVEDVVL